MKLRERLSAAVEGVQDTGQSRELPRHVAAALRIGNPGEGPGKRAFVIRGGRQAEQFVQLDAKLSKIMSGEARPADTAERIALAALCQLPCRQLHAAAARAPESIRWKVSKALASAFAERGSK